MNPSRSSAHHSTFSWPTVLIATAGAVIPAMAITMMGITLPEVRTTLRLSEIQAGSLFSIVFIVAVAASATAGRLADRIGRKLVLMTGIFSISTGCILSGLSGHYPLMLILLSTIGLGYGFITPSTYALMSDLMPGRRGLATALVSVAFGTGGILGSMISSALTARAGWRFAFFAVGGIGFLVALVQMMSIKGSKRDEATQRTLAPRRSIHRGLVLLALAEFSGASVFWSTASWGPTVLRATKAISLENTGVLMAIFGVAHMFGAITLGTLADRFGRKRVILWTAYPGALTVVIIYYLLGSPPTLAIGLFFLGFFQGSLPSLVVALAQESAAPEAVGTATGIVMSLHYVSAVITPLAAAQLIASTGNMLLSMVLASAVPFTVYGSLIAAVRERSS